MREAQMQALKLPHTGMAVTLDIGNPQNIHPANKQDVGARLARWALNRDYNRDVYVSGPLYQNMTLRDDKIVCSFDYVDGGLKLTADPQTHFEIAGADSVFRPAEVEINGNFLVVSHPDIDTPLAARYAWDNTSDAILFNEKGLPASSFRTDDWPR
ncbi:MAG: hypothetical protein U5R06_01525 [candidate division KSB1 bacterium]|nr:hypothetical protein [candidate division KSB1 bacterium]